MMTEAPYKKIPYSTNIEIASDDQQVGWYIVQ